jgi:hypothetical protein
MKAITRGMFGGLFLAMAAALTAHAQNTRLDKMVEAAIHGPEAKKVKYVDHEFNVKKAKITDRVTGVTKIEGQISHHLSYREDDQFYYTIEKKEGKITRFDFKIDRGGIAPYVGKLAKELPLVGMAQDEIVAAVRKLGQKMDGSWENEAEVIAYAIALRVDPESHNDLVAMLKQGKRVDLLGGGKTTTKVDTARPYVPKSAVGGVTVRDNRKK